jgi:hypothetical protein
MMRKLFLFLILIPFLKLQASNPTLISPYNLSSIIESPNPSPPSWIPTANMQFNMNVIAKIQVSQGVFSLNENDILGAFVGTECRGVASPFSSLGGMLFLTIGSNVQSGELVTFKIYRSATDQVINAIETFSFQNSAEMGTMSNPFIFTFLSPCTLSVNPSNQNIPFAPSGSTIYTVTTSCSWSAASNQSWCSVTPSGNGNGTITAGYSENTTSTSRTANITVTIAGSTPVVVTLTQAGASGLPNWTALPNLQFNMNIIGKIQISQGVYSLDQNDIIGAFVGNECRGVANPYNAFGGIFFLTIGSNIQSGELVTFKIYRFSSNEIIIANETVLFQNSVDLGTMANPNIFTYNKSKTLIVNALLQGLYKNGNLMNNTLNDLGETQWGDTVADKVLLELREAAYPYTLVESLNLNLQTNGKIITDVAYQNDGMYYIVIKNRNHLETWNSYPVSFAGDTINYDFTTGISQAFGDNQKEVSTGIFAMLVGDVNQDGVVDISDLVGMDADLTNGTLGYIVYDMNGDGVIDISDLVIIDENLTNGVVVMTP